jgi:hypothetical protein
VKSRLTLVAVGVLASIAAVGARCRRNREVSAPRASRATLHFTVIWTVDFLTELLGSNWQCTKTVFVLTTCTLRPYTGTAHNHHDHERAARTDAP